MRRFHYCLIVALIVFLFYILPKCSWLNLENKDGNWLKSDNWMGIEAIVNSCFILWSISMFRKQQKQIDEQRREADFDRQALMLQNRINLLAEREEKLSNYLNRSGVLHRWFLCYNRFSDSLNNEDLWVEFINKVKSAYFNIVDPVREIIQECHSIISLLEDVKAYNRKSGRKDLYYYMKLNIKFYNYCNLLLIEEYPKSDTGVIKGCKDVCEKLIRNIHKCNEANLRNNLNSPMINYFWLQRLSEYLTEPVDLIIKIDQLYQEITESN